MGFEEGILEKNLRVGEKELVRGSDRWMAKEEGGR